MNNLEKSYICIEGVIGVGKTSLARLLASKINARLVLEEVKKNPFLQDFYENSQENAFRTQINFLLLRYEQQKILRQPDLFHKVTIADYFFAKDRIFASVVLDDREFSLYERISDMLVTDVPEPDLIILLQASVQRLWDNIIYRNKPFEEFITREYLHSLVEAYNGFFFHYNNAPVLVVNTNDVDFINDPVEFENLITHINKSFHGVQYYNPKGK